MLDHRLQQLMEERGPITAHIEGLEAHIRGMYDELVRGNGVLSDTRLFWSTLSAQRG